MDKTNAEYVKFSWAIYGQFMGNFFINVGYFYKFGLYFAKNKTPERAFKSGDLRYFREK